MKNFKCFNEDKIKKIGSLVLCTTMMFSVSGCSYLEGGELPPRTIMESGEILEQDFYISNYYGYGIVVEGNNAIIYKIYSWDSSYGNYKYYSIDYDSNFVVTLPDDFHYISDCSLEDAEEYARLLISEEGEIRYFGISEEAIKTLAR